jgi:N-acetylmuramoyl-L-alanine amidase
MKPRIAATAPALLLLAALSAGALFADTMVIAGRRVDSRVRFPVDGEDIYAPLLAGIKYVDAAYRVDSDAITITTGGGHSVVISRRRPEATRDGVLRDLPGAPRTMGGQILLPARAVGSLLGCAVRWDAQSRILYLHPWLRRFSFQALPDRYRITVAAEGPIAYDSTQLENPPRLLLDLNNVDLAQLPAEPELGESYLRRVAIRQNSLAPQPEGDVVRLVVELSEWKPYRIRESDDRRRLEIEFPLPGAEELPPDVPPVVLAGLEFRRLSARLAAVVIPVFGTPFCTSTDSGDPAVVWVDVANAEDRLPVRRLRVDDALVAGASVAPAPGKPGALRIAISLKEPAQHAVVTEGHELRVLLGRFELAELRVVIDAGHGGHDTGAIGRSGLREKDLNLDIALRAYRLLLALGVNAVLTRRDANAVRPWARGNRTQQRQELLARCAIANDADAHLFVSVHANARQQNPIAYRGTETYYRKPDSARFAQVMQEEVVRATGLPDGGVHYHPKSIVVLYQTNMPAVLVEVGYLSHPADEAELLTSSFRDRAAQGIVNGIKRYVLEGGLLSRLAPPQRPAGSPTAPARDAAGPSGPADEAGTPPGDDAAPSNETTAPEASAAREPEDGEPAPALTQGREGGAASSR